MTTPYANKPDTSFWKRSVAGIKVTEVDPVMAPPFSLNPEDKIATAGSCFAQHIAKTLIREGFHYLVTEQGPEHMNYGLFPARFGNIYSTLQMLQLFQRAYGLFEPKDQIWRRGDSLVDPFRPLAAAFASVDEMEADNATHLSAVRKMFEDCDAFIFTLGLTEVWLSEADHAAVPLAPGVSNTRSDYKYIFSNRSVFEMKIDMLTFIDAFRIVNPKARIILTVSPIPLIATYEPQHVLVSTIYSKSALRVVAEEITKERDGIAYFPSFEIITGHHTGYKFFDENLREVTPDGVNYVMQLFKRHFLNLSFDSRNFKKYNTHSEIQQSGKLNANEISEVYKIICDEEAIDE